MTPPKIGDRQICDQEHPIVFVDVLIRRMDYKRLARRESEGEGIAMATDWAETWAKDFHDTYERSASQFGYETRRESAKPWAEIPENNRKLMIAVCAEVLCRFMNWRDEIASHIPEAPAQPTTKQLATAVSNHKYWKRRAEIAEAQLAEGDLPDGSEMGDGDGETSETD